MSEHRGHFVGCPAVTMGSTNAACNCDEREAKAGVQALRAQIAMMRKALEPFAKIPLHGIHGGPLTCARPLYEDGTDEDSARHKGNLSPNDFKQARAALSSVPDPGVVCVPAKDVEIAARKLELIWKQWAGDKESRDCAQRLRAYLKEPANG